MLSSRSWLSLLGELRQLESKMSNSSMPLSRPSVQLQMELSSDWSLASPSSTAHNHYTYTFLTLTTNTFNHYDESVISAAVKKSTYRTQTDIKWILGKVLSVLWHCSLRRPSSCRSITWLQQFPKVYLEMFEWRSSNPDKPEMWPSSIFSPVHRYASCVQIRCVYCALSCWSLSY